MNPLNPFELPPVVMEPVTPDELLEMIRGTVGRAYMASSYRTDRFMPKPHYIPGVNDYVTGTHYPDRQSGYYRDVCLSGYGAHPGDPIWLYLECTPVSVLCNLKTDAMYVRVTTSDAPWYPYTQPVPFNRFDLKEQLDDYC